MWHYAQGGASHGPVPHAELCRLFAAAELPLETHVWSPGMPEWAEASTIDEFRGVYGKGFGPRRYDPPPLPANARGAPNLTPIAPAPAPEIPLGPPLARASLTPEIDRATRARDDDGDAPLARPWVRWWARWLDVWLLALVVVYAWPEIYVRPRWQLRLADIAVSFVATFWFALQLWLFGTTPGKAFFRISVRTREGLRPTFEQALGRELRQWMNGQAFGIPLLNLVAGIVGYSTLKSEGSSSWDHASGLVVRHRPVGVVRALAYPVVVVVLGAAMFRNLPTENGRRFREYLADATPRWPSADAIRITPSAPPPESPPESADQRPPPRSRVLTVPAAPNEYSTEKVIIKPMVPSTRPSKLPRPRVATAPPAD
jgi:uncharacterized RDD family membrane protein YckC